MDPNAALARIQELVREILDNELASDEAVELAEAVDDLDEWIGSGGFIPTEWRKGRP
jgi:hypothetical protein